MRKYSTPEIELEVFKTSDVITASGLRLSYDPDIAGEGNSISWNDTNWWQTIS